MQYNAALAITGAIKWTSQTKLYKELGLESLKFRRWFRQLCTLFKIKTSGKSEYLLKLISTGQHSYITWSLDEIETYYCRTNTFKIFFSIYNSWVEQTWFRHSKSKSYAVFRNALLKIGRPTNAQFIELIIPWD